MKDEQRWPEGARMGIIDKQAAGVRTIAGVAGAERFRQAATLSGVAVRARQRVPDRPCADCLDQPPRAGPGRPNVPGRVAFWLVAVVLTATMLGTTLPTPLYVIYQAQWHFSSAIVTVTFAVYAVAVLAAAGLGLLLVPETVSPRGRPTLRFAGLGLPAQGLGEFAAAAVAGFAAFSLLGLFSALAPTFLGSVLHENSHAVQGAVVFGLLAVGAATQRPGTLHRLLGDQQRPGAHRQPAADEPHPPRPGGHRVAGPGTAG
jgi:hypothetical protein